MTICDVCTASVPTLTHSSAKNWVTLKMLTSTGHTIHNHHLCPSCYQGALNWLKNPHQPSSPPSGL